MKNIKLILALVLLVAPAYAGFETGSQNQVLRVPNGVSGNYRGQYGSLDLSKSGTVGSSLLGPANGGTGVANNAASTLTISGNFATTLTVTAGTGVTLPTTGTLSTLAGAEVFTNKTLTQPIVNGQVNALTNKAANYTITLADDVITCDATSGAFTLTLPNISGTSGKRYIIKKKLSDASFNAVTISGNANIDSSASTTLNTQGETIELVSDGAIWNVANRFTATDWISYTPTGGWVSNATYTGLWRRQGPEIEVQVKIALAGAPSGNCAVDLPSGLTFDSARLVQMDLQTTPGMNSSANHSGSELALISSFSSSSRMSIQYVSSLTGGTTTVSPTNPVTWANTDYLIIRFKGPITGWKS